MIKKLKIPKKFEAFAFACDTEEEVIKLMGKHYVGKSNWHSGTIKDGKHIALFVPAIPLKELDVEDGDIVFEDDPDNIGQD